jgi:hypothetical protein
MNMLLPSADMNNVMKPMSNNIQNGMYCRRCGYGGCDVRFMNCGCSVHAVSLVFYLICIRGIGVMLEPELSHPLSSSCRANSRMN